jgi:hypothetical protein
MLPALEVGGVVEIMLLYILKVFSQKESLGLG